MAYIIKVTGTGLAKMAGAQAATNTIELYKYSAGLRVKLTDADLTHTTQIRISGFYQRS